MRCLHWMCFLQSSWGGMAPKLALYYKQMNGVRGTGSRGASQITDPYEDRAGTLLASVPPLPDKEWVVSECKKGLMHLLEKHLLEAYYAKDTVLDKTDTDLDHEA